ncbi:hypothetical protein SDC9_112416 [bioreactor metagenome]|uniref:Uncharacterized protein n=1 Tax=bioreactor metagenome TaxID=1076179 RepID=A0A645BJ72_9ZZZZ
MRNHCNEVVRYGNGWVEKRTIGQPGRTKGYYHHGNKRIDHEQPENPHHHRKENLLGIFCLQFNIHRFSFVSVN